MSEQNSQSADTPPIPPAMQMMQTIWPGAMAAQAIYAGARFGIADLLKDGPKTIEEIARATRTHGPSLHRLLRALTSLRIFEESTPGVFRNTELSDTLRRDIPGSMSAWALFLGAPFNWKLWGNLEESVRSGEPAAERVYGKSFWMHLAENAADAEVFNGAMSAGSQMSATAIVSAYDFSSFRKIVDVGGGHGMLLHGILSATPNLRGVLYDLPEVVANAAVLRTGEVASRAEIIGGSFFETVPSGADAYVLQGIIHDWSDNDALKILRACRKAISPDGKLLVSTSLLKSSNETDRANFMDIYMMLYGGCERTEAQLRTLLDDAGFSLKRVIPTSIRSFILESEPAG